MDPQRLATPQKPRILIVEDERFISELYTRALERAGYEIVSVFDGQNALNESLSNTYDIILLDIMIPTLNGVDLLYQIKADTVQPPLKSKIVITTNLDQPDETRNAIEKMADGYFIKAEITPNILVSYVNQVLGRQGQQA